MLTASNDGSRSSLSAARAASASFFTSTVQPRFSSAVLNSAVVSAKGCHGSSKRAPRRSPTQLASRAQSASAGEGSSGRGTTCCPRPIVSGPKKRRRCSRDRLRSLHHLPPAEDLRAAGLGGPPATTPAAGNLLAPFRRPCQATQHLGPRLEARVSRSSILNVTFDCADTEAMARFWSEVTRWPRTKVEMPGNPFWWVGPDRDAYPHLVFVDAGAQTHQEPSSPRSPAT